MASITQTIQDYIGGISEQSDQKKLPGQVRSVVNAIPDLTYGLYKRPGTKRIGSAPLTNVQSNGSWFHYYRDESEGSYIGQIASDGKIRIWSCNDGTEKNVWYHTDNSAYNSGTAAHTSITSYLTPSSATATEDLQALTINDTTFLNNRTKIIATTGTTPSATDTHYAYLELLRTENGRQYGLNAYSAATTTNLSRATRIKIKSDTLNEGNGTGDCPGVATQVFSKDDGSKTNLIFRITTLGQQGKTGNGTNASDYQCSYNRDIQLLHGGEGWAVGDEVTVSMDQAKTTYSYTVEVTEIETVAVKGTINGGVNGILRPAPTPFDSDTAVTTDTVLGGIQASLSGTGITSTVIGNGLYLTASSAFNIEVVDQDLMRVMQTTANDVTKLPLQCKLGYIVQITNTRSADEDDYYVKFSSANSLDGSGSWVECAKPGIALSFDTSTMPHVLTRQPDGDFLVKAGTYTDRIVGDNATNPIPTFVGQSINKILFFRNRLCFLSGENVITSRPGELAIPSFWSWTALTVSAIDPIDIACASTYPSELFDGVELNTGLVVFSTNQQFLLASDAEIMNPDTAKLKKLSVFNYNETIPPISLGTTVGFVDSSGKYSRFNELFNVQREGEPDVVETSKVVPSLLPKDIDLITNSRENGIILFGKTGQDELQGYKYYQLADKRGQSSWFKWKFNNPLKYHFIVNDEYFFLDTDNFLQKMQLIQADADPSIDQDDVNYLIHLDNYTTVGSGTYSSTTQLTTFTNQSDWIDQVTSPNGKLVVIDIDSNTAREGRYAECTVINSDDFTVPGDWSSATLQIGYLYDYQIDFPRIFVTKVQGEKSTADVSSSLVIHRLKLGLGKSGLYETTLTRVGKDPYTEVYESSVLDEYLVSDAPYLEEYVKTVPVYEKNNNVEITLKSTHPSPCTLRSMSWEGDYTPKFYRRA